MRWTVATLVAASAVFGLSACGSEPGPSNEERATSACQSAVAGKMKDPDSAQFRNIAVVDGGANYDDSGVYWKVSGEVNAKNGFGGMGGFSGFSCEATLPTGGEMFASYINVH